VASPLVGLECEHAEGFEAGEQLVGPPVVVHPDLVVGALVSREPFADCLVGDLAGPLEIRTVKPGRLRMAGAVGPPATGATLDDGTWQDKAAAGNGDQLLGYLTDLGLVLRLQAHESSFPPGIHHLGHGLLYIYCCNEHDRPRRLHRAGQSCRL